MRRSADWVPIGIALLSIAACSPDFIPIHYSRVNSAKSAKGPLKLTPDAPGAFVRKWTFETPSGYRFDPSEIEFTSGVARLVSESRQPAFLETSQGMPFAALFQATEASSPGKATSGKIRYQLSSDRARWHYYQQGRWRMASPVAEQSSSISEIQEGLRFFHTEIGPGQLFVRVFLLPGESPQDRAELRSLEIHGIAPKTDGWD